MLNFMIPPKRSLIWVTTALLRFRNGGGEFPRFGDVKGELKNDSPLAFKGLLLLYRMNVLVTLFYKEGLFG